MAFAVPPLPIFFRTAAFDPSGRSVAISLGSGRVGLVDPATGEIRARLAGPSSAPIVDLTFSPSGSSLAVAPLAHSAVVWSFGPLRRRLADLGLEWDDRPVPVDSPTSSVVAMTLAEPFHPRQWAEHWRVKIFVESLEGKFPDAIHAAEMALAACPPDDAPFRATLRLARGKAFLNNDAPNAALDDFRAAAADAASRD